MKNTAFDVINTIPSLQLTLIIKFDQICSVYSLKSTIKQQSIIIESSSMPNTVYNFGQKRRLSVSFNRETLKVKR